MSFNSDRIDKMKLNFAKEMKDKALAIEQDLIAKKGKLSIADKVRLSGLFEKTGEAFFEIGDSKASTIGFSYYKKAEQYAPYSSTKEGIGKRLEKRINAQENYYSAGSKVNGILSIASLLASLFFVSAGITGYSILNLESNNFQTIGLCFFACGLIFALVYLRCKDKKKKK